MHLPRVRHDVVAGAEIQGQLRRQLDVVLRKESHAIRDQPDQARRKFVAQDLIRRADQKTRIGVAARRSDRADWW